MSGLLAWLLALEPRERIALGSAAVALLAAIATITFAVMNFRVARTNIVLSRRNLDRELINQRLSLITTRQKYFEDIRKWADKACDDLTEAIHLCDLDPTRTGGEPFFDRRHRLRTSMSSLIDRGRLFFPNILADDFCAEKELGYQGYRHEVLDGLVAAYKSVGKLDYRNKENNVSVRNELTTCKRHFVGRIQSVLDPGKQVEEFERIIATVINPGERST